MQAPRQRLIDWDNLRIKLIRCYDGRVPSKGLGEHTSPHSTAWLIRRGRVRVTDDTRQVTAAGAGTWVFPRPGRRFQEFSPGARLLSISFTAEYLTGQLLLDVHQTITLSAASFPELQAVAARLVDAASPVTDLLWAQLSVVELNQYLTIQSLLLSWVDIWCRTLLSLGYDIPSAHTSDPRVLKAVQFLEAHLDEGQLTTERIARSAGVSISQLNRLFLRETGHTLSAFHTQRRLERAMLLLAHSNLSMKEIAFDLGFKHPGHFTAWFKQHHHQPPSRYRRSPTESPRFSSSFKPGQSESSTSGGVALGSSSFNRPQ